MKYYDGMGTDVSLYVQGLEQKIQALELALAQARKAPYTEPAATNVVFTQTQPFKTNEPLPTQIVLEHVEEEGIGKVELGEVKRKRSKKEPDAPT